MTTRFDLETMLIDARYAARQCRDHRDPARAADALARMEERLDRLLAEEVAEDDDAAALEMEEMHSLCDSYRTFDDDDSLPF
jgi:hypothetical protein